MEWHSHEFLETANKNIVGETCVRPRSCRIFFLRSRKFFFRNLPKQIFERALPGRPYAFIIFLKMRCEWQATIKNGGKRHTHWEKQTTAKMVLRKREKKLKDNFSWEKRQRFLFVEHVDRFPARAHCGRHYLGMYGSGNMCLVEGALNWKRRFISWTKFSKQGH